MSSGMINLGYKYATAFGNHNLGITFKTCYFFVSYTILIVIAAIMLELDGSIEMHFYQLANDMSS